MISLERRHDDGDEMPTSPDRCEADPGSYDQERRREGIGATAAVGAPTDERRRS